MFFITFVALNPRSKNVHFVLKIGTFLFADYIRAFFPEKKDFLGMVVENIRAEVWQVEISIKDFNSYTKLIRRETASIPEYNLLFWGAG